MRAVNAKQDLDYNYMERWKERLWIMEGFKEALLITTGREKKVLQEFSPRD